MAVLIIMFLTFSMITGVINYECTKYEQNPHCDFCKKMNQPLSKQSDNRKIAKSVEVTTVFIYVII